MPTRNCPGTRVARRASSGQVLTHVLRLTHARTVRVCGQLRSSSKTPLNLISRGLSCTCRNFKGEPLRLRRRRFARETGTSRMHQVSYLVLFHLAKLDQINAGCIRNVALSMTQRTRTQNRFFLVVFMSFLSLLE